MCPRPLVWWSMCKSCMTGDVVIMSKRNRSQQIGDGKNDGHNKTDFMAINHPCIWGFWNYRTYNDV